MYKDDRGAAGPSRYLMYRYLSGTGLGNGGDDFGKRHVRPPRGVSQGSYPGRADGWRVEVLIVRDPAVPVQILACGVWLRL